MTLKRSNLNKIHNISIFSGLSWKSKQLLATKSIEKKLRKDEILFLEGDPCIGLVYVINGCIKVYKGSRTGRQQAINYFDEGDLFNEIGVLSGKENVVNAVAMTTTELLIISCDDFQNIISAEPQLALNLIHHLASRIEYLSNLIESLSLMSVSGRLSAFLLAETTNEQPHIIRPTWLTQSELAARLGTVPDVVHRNLKKFENEGLIKLSRSNIVILDRGRLAQLTMLS